MKRYRLPLIAEAPIPSDVVLPQPIEYYYLASEVDAHVAELERLLREAHFFVQEDFKFSGHWSEVKVEDVCATPRYLRLWKDLNKALGL